MSFETLSGKTYGPHPFSTVSPRVDDYVAATGDDLARWGTEAPPALAGAMLFVAAPQLLSDPEVVPMARSVIHGEQTFTWHAPIPLNAELEVGGTVTRVRERGGVMFVGFEMTVSSPGGPAVVTGSSTFLMSGTAPPAGVASEEHEPDAEDGSRLNPATSTPPVEVGADPPPLMRSASRVDLVRYAAASRDFNPIHWDHQAAVAAGLPGVVVHGLLQSAWLCQVVQRCGPTLRSARFRYRAPLRPAVLVTASGTRTATGWETNLSGGDGTEYVVGSFVAS